MEFIDEVLFAGVQPGSQVVAGAVGFSENKENVDRFISALSGSYCVQLMHDQKAMAWVVEATVGERDAEDELEFDLVVLRDWMDYIKWLLEKHNCQFVSWSVTTVLDQVTYSSVKASKRNVASELVKRIRASSSQASVDIEVDLIAPSDNEASAMMTDLAARCFIKKFESTKLGISVNCIFAAIPVCEECFIFFGNEVEQIAERHGCTVKGWGALPG